MIPAVLHAPPAPRRRAGRKADAPGRYEVWEHPSEKITPNQTSCGEYESENTPHAGMARSFGRSDPEAAHETRAGGAGGSSAPAGVNETGVRRGENTA